MSVLSNPEFLVAIIENLSVGISVVDEHGKIVLWNRHAERLTGLNRRDVIGHSVREGFLGYLDNDNNEMAGEAAPAVVAMREGREVRVELSLRHRSGQRVPIRLQVRVIRDEHRTTVGAVESFDET